MLRIAAVELPRVVTSLCFSACTCRSLRMHVEKKNSDMRNINLIVHLNSVLLAFFPAKYV